MNDIEIAKKTLEDGGHTCVLVGGDTTLTSDEKGIKPMMGFLALKTDLKGFSAADRTIGKAAAMLFARAGVVEVYAFVMSKSAIKTLEKYKIKYSFHSLVDAIINRAGTGLCPMEQAVIDIENCDQAYVAIINKLESLKAGS